MIPNISHYTALFECAPLGILISDADGTCIDANQSICRMLGFTHEELVGLHRWDYVVEKEIPGGTSMRDAIEGGSAARQFRLFVRKDGSTLEAESLTTVMPDGTRLAFIRDTAERKREDARVRRLIDSSKNSPPRALVRRSKRNTSARTAPAWQFYWGPRILRTV
jgi:PAS domain S-box-containing protein